MGYTTEFRGEFTFEKPLSPKATAFINKLCETRRMGRNIEGYGIQGEFFVDGEGFRGQGSESNIINHNEAPSTQPGLWCQWEVTNNGTTLEWNGGEKFYHYVEWLFYLIEKIIRPNGYVLNGEIKWRGEDFDDTGKIEVMGNELFVNGSYTSQKDMVKMHYDFTNGHKEERDYMRLDVVWLENENTKPEPKKEELGITKHDISKMSRKDLVEFILNESGDEYENKGDIIQLAVESVSELRKRAKHLLNYLATAE